MFNDDTEKVYKYDNAIYNLHIYDSYIQLTSHIKENDHISVSWLSISCVKENTGQTDYIMNECNNNLQLEMKKLDSFQVLLFLNDNFPSEVATAFLDTCKEYGFTPLE